MVKTAALSGDHIIVSSNVHGKGLLELVVMTATLLPFRSLMKLRRNGFHRDVRDAFR